MTTDSAGLEPPPPSELMPAIASVHERLIAFLVDALVIFLPAFIASALQQRRGDDDSAPVQLGLWLWIVVLLPILITLALECSLRGTIGKRALHVIVRSRTATDATLTQRVQRAFIRRLPELLLLACIAIGSFKGAGFDQVADLLGSLACPAFCVLSLSTLVMVRLGRAPPHDLLARTTLISLKRVAWRQIKPSFEVVTPVHGDNL